MLNSQQIAIASKLLDKMSGLRAQRELLEAAVTFEVASFFNSISIQVPAGSIETVKSIAFASIDQQIADVQARLIELGVTAD